jgi:hypothetical protein
VLLASGLLILAFWGCVGLFMTSYRRIEMPQLVSKEAEPAPVLPS